MLQKTSDQLYTWKNWQHLLSGQVHLNTATIKNKNLARELEDECAKQNGILTYGQYAQIEQYGQNGYHSTTDKNGFTNVGQRWAAALAQFCFKNNYNSIIEFGCGSGELGISTIKAFKKLSNQNISWTGIEINKELHAKIKENFQHEKIENSLKIIASSLKDLSEKNKALIVFPYSLDSIPPEIFLSINKNLSCPDSLLGIRIKNGKLHEEILTPSTLEQKGISLQNGFYRSGTGYTFDLKSWKLRKGQRAYIPVAAFSCFLDYVNQMPRASAFLIIDEFRPSPFYFQTGNLGIPKDLYAKNQEYKNIPSAYREAGQHIAYYPIYQDSFYKFLHKIGFRSIQYDAEQKLAAGLTGKKWIEVRQKYLTQTFIARDKIEIKNSIIPIEYHPRKFI